MQRPLVVAGSSRALCRFVRPTDSRPVLVLTDSTTAQHALPRGYSPSFVVNAIAARCRASFQAILVDTQHVPGVHNEVDPLSRGQQLIADPLATVQRMMGKPGGGNGLRKGNALKSAPLT